MAYVRTTILTNMITLAKTVTIANGYETDVGSNKVFAATQRPRAEDLIDKASGSGADFPHLWILDGGPEVPNKIEKGTPPILHKTLKPKIFGVVPEEADPETAQAALNSLIGDAKRLVGRNPQWTPAPTGNNQAITDTEIGAVVIVSQFVRPYSAFELSLNVNYHSDMENP